MVSTSATGVAIGASVMVSVSMTAGGSVMVVMAAVSTGTGTGSGSIEVSESVNSFFGPDNASSVSTDCATVCGTACMAKWRMDLLLGLHQSTALQVSGLVRMSRGGLVLLTPSFSGVVRFSHKASSLDSSFARACANVGAARPLSVWPSSTLELGVNGDADGGGAARGMTGDMRVDVSGGPAARGCAGDSSDAHRVRELGENSAGENKPRICAG
mmetsp:Transcript_110162/g.187625  ORF Transcript_110162/g.187625 Transcript_110162/m.187625 type:complete len:214 (+) Transcript_110162:1310-1951(+)